MPCQYHAQACGVCLSLCEAEVHAGLERRLPAFGADSLRSKLSDVAVRMF